MLCRSCNDARVREFAEKIGAKAAAVTNADKAKVTTRSSNKAATSSSSSVSSSAAAAPLKKPAPTVELTVTVNERRQVVINELLSYISYYRDKGNAAGLHKVTGRFYTAAEISSAKKCLIDTFSMHVTDCPYTVERRNSTARQAYDAELEDILGIIETLDDKDVLKNVVFAAVNLDRVPRYGPEEITVCAVVDRQVGVETKLEQLTNELTCVRSRDETLTELMSQVKHLDAKMTSLVDVINEQSKQIRQQQKQPPPTKPGGTGQQPSVVAVDCSRPQQQSPPPVDRSKNVVVFGIAESRNVDVWRQKLNDVLTTVTGREVQIDDAFRLGKYNNAATDSNSRPILVRLHNVWDRRLIISNAWSLSKHAEFKRSVFIRPDEPVETRRRNALNALYERASRKTGSNVEMTDDKLFVDGKLIYSIKDGRKTIVDNVENDMSVHDDD